MAHTWYGDIEKPLVMLLGSEGLGIIVLWPSGVVYANQAGGDANRPCSDEGIYVPLERDVPLEPAKHGYVSLSERLTTYFYRSDAMGYGGINNADADAIDAILANSYTTRILSVDRNLLSESLESWVYVNVGNHPARHPQPGLADEQWNYWLYGLGAVRGVLTW